MPQIEPLLFGERPDSDIFVGAAQRSSNDLESTPLAAPVIYPGSIERTSSAERDEAKGYVTLELGPDEPGDADAGGRLVQWRFKKLPARPLITIELEVTGLDGEQVRRSLTKQLSKLDPDGVVSIRVQGTPTPSATPVLRAPSIRTLTPKTMTVSLARPAKTSRSK